MTELPQGEVARHLLDNYKIESQYIRHVQGGHEGLVWQVAQSQGPALCVKWFSHVSSEEVRRRTALMDILHKGGIPSPRVFRTNSGELTTSVRGRSLQVCEWVGGLALPEMAPQAGYTAGRVLATIHHALRLEQAVPGSSIKRSWLSGDEILSDTREILVRLRSVRQMSQLDSEIQCALERRLAALDTMDQVRSGMPSGAGRQILHGDYTRANLLFFGEELIGVIDVAGCLGSPLWELARIAFEPKTVAARPDWLSVAARTVSGYREVDGDIDVAPVVRLAALYHLSSSWGVMGRYGEHGAVSMTGNERYWLNRQLTGMRLLERLPEIEEAVVKSHTPA